MLKGIIFVSEAVLSLDLRTTLSKHYRIVNTFRNAEDINVNTSGIDFIIIDTDPLSENQLRNILSKLNLSQDVKIISISSFADKLPRKPFKHAELQKPIDNKDLIRAIEEL